MRLFSIQKRLLSFSYPTPRKLKDLVKLPLLEREPESSIKTIWNDYHKDHKDAFGRVLNGEQARYLLDQAKTKYGFIILIL